MLDGLYRLDKRNLAEASGVLARAFQDDPMFVYMFPDTVERRNVLPVVFKAIAGLGIASVTAYAPSESIEGCIFLTGQGKSRFSLALLAAYVKSLSLPLRIIRHTRMRPLARRAWAMRKAVSQLRKYKDSLGDCIHVDLVAVDEPYRGRKYMSMMIRAALVEADKAGVKCVLDTESEVNLPVYRHFGFSLIKAITVVPDRLTLYIMAYDPMTQF